MAIALGIDFEDIIHTPAYQGLENPGDTGVDLFQTTSTLLDLFDRYNVSVTFFVVADLVETHPELIQRIAAAGHEIASHTVTHCSLTDVGDETVVDELHRSREILEGVIDSSVEGFRAPTCKIDDQVYRVLEAEGYSYSSSVMPSIPIPGFYSNEYTFSTATSIQLPTGSITEIPLSVHPQIRLPLSGAWMRLLGKTYTLHGLRAALNDGLDVVTYSHPWEFESLRETPLPFRNRVRTGDWLVDTYKRILKLETEFLTVRELMDRAPIGEIYTVS